MDDYKGLSEQQLEALVNFASAKLGVTPQKLAQAVQNGGVTGLMDLSPDKAKKLNALIGDKEKAEELLRSPMAQQLLDKIQHQEEAGNG